MPSRNVGGVGGGGGKGGYNLVKSDNLDTRVPLLPEEAFQKGIQFSCKFIGSMDIPRPTSRVEIVAAMRRVRFEFKQRGVKKKKVYITLSMDGIKTNLRKRKSRKRRLGRKKDVYMDVENTPLIESHPIYRIFYVSHDSQDVKIFSYIARETSTNVFHCCVFKSNSKAQAMRIVRTVGQAFEVCHKLVAPDEDNNVEDFEPSKEVVQEEVPIKRGGSLEEKSSSHSYYGQGAAHKAHKILSKLAHRRTSDHSGENNNKEVLEFIQETQTSLEKEERFKRPKDLNLEKDEKVENLLTLDTPQTPNNHLPPSPTHKLVTGVGGNNVNSFQQFHFDSSTELWQQLVSPQQQLPQQIHSMAAVHEAQLLREKLEQQQQQTQAALAQINLLRDQLAAESAARIEAQSRTHQLLLHNKELLDHLQSLVRHIQDLEGKINTSASSLNNSPTPALPQAVQLHHHQQSFYTYPPTPTPAPPPASPSISFQEIENLRRQNSALLETMLYEQNARNFFNMAAAAAVSQPPTASNTPAALRLTSSPFSPFPINPYFYSPPPPHPPPTSSSATIMGNPSADNYATVFTSHGEPFIRPLENNFLSLPTPSGTPKLGQIGRNASADEAARGSSYCGDEADTASLRRQGILGRSVSEKIGHRSELMSQVQRTAWARHTTK